jgi:hypothetical protein
LKFEPDLAAVEIQDIETTAIQLYLNGSTTSETAIFAALADHYVQKNVTYYFSLYYVLGMSGPNSHVKDVYLFTKIVNNFPTLLSTKSVQTFIIDLVTNRDKYTTTLKKDHWLAYGDYINNVTNNFVSTGLRSCASIFSFIPKKLHVSKVPDRK